MALLRVLCVWSDEDVEGVTYASGTANPQCCLCVTNMCPQEVCIITSAGFLSPKAKFETFMSSASEEDLRKVHVDFLTSAQSRWTDFERAI